MTNNGILIFCYEYILQKLGSMKVIVLKYRPDQLSRLGDIPEKVYLFLGAQTDGKYIRRQHRIHHFVLGSGTLHT